jgi:hypothetical protein
MARATQLIIIETNKPSAQALARAVARGMARMAAAQAIPKQPEPDSPVNASIAAD